MQVFEEKRSKTCPRDLADWLCLLAALGRLFAKPAVMPSFVTLIRKNYRARRRPRSKLTEPDWQENRNDTRQCHAL